MVFIFCRHISRQFPSKRMKAISLFLVITTSVLIISCSGGVKDYDGTIYKTVKMGNQVWMAENLNVSHFRNGDIIPEVKSAEEWIKYGKEGKPAWCYMENDPENGIKYGKLYNWYATVDPRVLAPEGWHIASDEEWTEMTDYLGGGILAALKMRTTGLEKNDQASGGGFSGHPAGCRNSYGNFYGMDSFGYWWSTTGINSTDAWMRILNYVKCDLNNRNFNKIYGSSVRCIRN